MPEEEKSYIGKYIDLSTGHITKQDNDLLQQDELGNPVIAFCYDRGFFIPVWELDDQELRGYGYSESFIKVFQFVQRHDAHLLRLDADGELVDDPKLDTHDW